MNIKPIEPLQTQSRLPRLPHMLAGAMYGFLLGTAFVLSAAVVDRLLHPDLPLGMDWSALATRVLWIVLGLILIGIAAALFNETIPSLLLGAVLSGILALTSALLSSSTTQTGIKVMVLIFALMPVSAMSLPVTLVLRWLVDRHEKALKLQRTGQVFLLVLLAIALGAGSGFFMKMSPQALQATRFMDRLMQTAPLDDKNPIHNLPGFASHAAMRYRLFQSPSQYSTEGFDVRAEYPDGYGVRCTVVLYPERDPFETGCESYEQ